jgi:glycosyltransferase involved in cell wall biosynthesis
MKGGEYEITLASPASPAQEETHRASIAEVCDRFVPWAGNSAMAVGALRIASIASTLPIPVATDRSRRGRRIVRRELDAAPDVVVFDFPHSAVLAPAEIRVPSVMFTHNIEAEIFDRHARVSSFPSRLLWQNQLGKMRKFERGALDRFDTAVAVSERDADVFRKEYSTRNVQVIGTGVDLEFFSYAGPGSSDHVVFTGSMDWLANRDGIDFLLERIWPNIAREVSSARMTVVGRDPPPWLARKAERWGSSWQLTGFVDDVRSYVHAAGVYVIPLRVGGGTRLKVYEAMAMGCPVVSTSIGIEGLPLVPGEHYLRADGEADFAAAVVELMKNSELRAKLAKAARRFVEEHCSFRAVAREFERICMDTEEALRGRGTS